MEKNIDNLFTAFKKLPKETAPENFEEKLEARIKEYEDSKIKQPVIKVSFWNKIFNPVLAPAFAFGLVAVVLVFTLQNNLNILPKAKMVNSEEILSKSVLSNSKEVAKKTEIIRTPQTSVTETAKPRKQRSLNLEGFQGTSLDEVYYSPQPGNFQQASLSNAPLEIDYPQPLQSQLNRGNRGESADSSKKELKQSGK